VGADQGLTRLFFDGSCGLCHGAVRLVARWDRSGRIRFAPLQGETFQRLIPEAARIGLPDSLVVLTADGVLLAQSEGVIHLLRVMGGVWPACGRALSWVPARLRDRIYREIARRRSRGGACGNVPPAGSDRLDS
jgi:predicted DCC family thiol-disulfide oxidoreductase YuxK